MNGLDANLPAFVLTPAFLDNDRQLLNIAAAAAMQTWERLVDPDTRFTHDSAARARIFTQVNEAAAQSEDPVIKEVFQLLTATSEGGPYGISYKLDTGTHFGYMLLLALALDIPFRAA